MDKTLETLRSYQEQQGLSDEEVDEVMNRIISVVNDGVMGKFAPETIDLFMKGINHDNDVAIASEEGEVAGRNARIEEQLRKSRKGDGTQPPGGRNGEGSRPNRGTIFDLAQEAM